MTTSLPPDPISAQPMIISYLQINLERTYVEVSVFTLLLVHIIATLPIEVERIWMARQSRMTFLFYIIRYLPPICIGLGLCIDLSYSAKYLGNLCTVWSWVDVMFCTMVAVSLAEVLMVMRVWALYRFKKRMLAFLVAIFVGRTVIGFWSGARGTQSMIPVLWPRDALPMPGCPVRFIPDDSWSVVINCAFNMVTTGIIFICMLGQCLARNALDRPFLGTWRDLFGIRTAYPIVHILIRDGCLYFLMVFFAEMFFLISATNENSPLAPFTLAVIQAVYSIPATRLVLNLRDQTQDHGRQGQRPDDIVLEDISSINFAARHSSELQRSGFTV